MRKVEKILVPIDFSEESARALRNALALAKETKANLIALHVVERTDDRDFFVSSVAMLEGSPFPVNDFRAVPVDVLLQERSLDLWNFIERILGGHNQVRITQRVRMGSLIKEIAAVTREENIDVMVLELRKRFPFPDLTTLRLLRMIRSLPCAVLLGSPAAKTDREPKRPLVLAHPTPKETIA